MAVQQVTHQHHLRESTASQPPVPKMEQKFAQKQNYSCKTKFLSNSFHCPQLKAFGQHKGIQWAWLPHPRCFEQLAINPSKASLQKMGAKGTGGWGQAGQAHSSPFGRSHSNKMGIASGRGQELEWEQWLPYSHSQMSWQPRSCMPCSDSSWLQDTASPWFPGHQTRPRHAQRTLSHLAAP